MCYGFVTRVDGPQIKLGVRGGEDVGLRDGVGKRVAGTFELGVFVAVGIRDGEKEVAESGAAHLVFGREIGAAEKRFAIGKQKTGERPTALAGDGTDRGLIAGVNVGAVGRSPVF